MAATLVRGTTRILAGTVAAKSLDFALYLILARALGVEQFGLFTYALSFTLLFSVLSDFGVTIVFTREVARAPQRARALLADVMAVKLALAGATMAVTLGGAWLVPDARRVAAMIAVFTLGMLLNSIATTLGGLLRAAGRGGRLGTMAASRAAVALAWGAALVANGVGVWGAALAYLAGGIAQLVLALLWTRGLSEGGVTAAGPAAAAAAPTATAAKPTATPAAPVADRWRTRWALLLEAAPLALSGVFIAVYFRMDSLLLQAMKGAAAVGLYGGVYRFFELFALFGAAYHALAFPVMARAADAPGERLAVLCRKSLRVHLLLSTGAATFVTVFAGRIVEVVLGSAYAAAAPALAVLVWAGPGSLMAATLIHLLAAQRRQAEGARAVAITAAANVVMNLALIPAFSILGAAIATVASEILCFVLLLGAFREKVPVAGLRRMAWRPLAAGLALGPALAVTSQLLPSGMLGLGLAAALAALGYLALLLALRAITAEDGRLLSEALPDVLRRGAFGR